MGAPFFNHASIRGERDQPAGGGGGVGGQAKLFPRVDFSISYRMPSSGAMRPPSHREGYGPRGGLTTVFVQRAEPRHGTPGGVAWPPRGPVGSLTETVSPKGPHGLAGGMSYCSCPHGEGLRVGHELLLMPHALRVGVGLHLFSTGGARRWGPLGGGRSPQ